MTRAIARLLIRVWDIKPKPEPVPTAEQVAEIIDSLPGWKSFRFPNSDPQGSVMGRKLG